MRKILLSLVSLALVTFAGCSADAASAVAGTYELDNAALEAQFMAQMPEEMKGNEQAAAMMKKMAEGAKGTIDLKADGSADLSMTMPNPMGGAANTDRTTGSWKAEGDQVTIVAKDKDGKEEPRTLTLTGGKLVLAEEKDGKKVEFTFVKKTK